MKRTPETRTSPSRKLTKKQQAELLRLQVDTVGQPGQARANDSERHLGRHALGGLGRQDRHPHHGPARFHQPAPVRAGGRPRPAAHCLRGQPGNWPVRTRVRQHLRRAVHLPAARIRRRDNPRPAEARRPRSSPIRQNAAFAITWPNVIRIDHVYRPRLLLDWAKVQAPGAERKRDRAGGGACAHCRRKAGHNRDSADRS